MAIYNNQDQKNLEQLLEEKWFDRFKARGAEALGSTKGLGQQVAGGFQQAAGSALSKAGDWVGGDNKLSRKGGEFSKSGQEKVQSGEASGHNAKIDYLRKNIDNRISKFVEDIKNDIQKLGLDIGNIEMVSGINDALNVLKKNMSGNTPPPLPQQSGATPPPLPKQQTDIDDNEPTYNINFGDEGGQSTTPTKKNQKKFNYNKEKQPISTEKDLSNVSNMTYKQGKTDWDTVPGAFKDSEKSLSDRSKRGAETRKQREEIYKPDPRKGKPRQFQITSPDHDEEDLDDMFWK